MNMTKTAVGLKVLHMPSSTRHCPLGYVVREVFEVHHYEKWTHQGGAGAELPLFAGYINAFIKMKLEASGWPEQCKTEEEKQQFLDECFLQDGIELDRTELDKGLNPALRQIAVSFSFTF